MRRSATLVALGLAVAVNGHAAGARPEDACQLLPVVLDVEASGTRYRTDISFANPGSGAQEVSVHYTASLGSAEGTGDGRFSVAAGQQLLATDGIEFLRQLGIGIPQATPDAPQAGTLRICRLSPGEGPIGVTARITSPTLPPSTAGSAGVSFQAVPADEGFTGRATVFGLRRNAVDRSNVAVYNPGVEPVSVRVTLVSGSSDGGFVISEKETLGGYGWRQFPVPFGELRGVDQGYVLIERVSPGGFFGAYGVVNDNDTNDGSFIPAVDESGLGTSWMVPVLVDSPSYRTELVLANPGAAAATFALEYRDSVSLSGGPLSATISLPAHRQAVVPDVFELFPSGSPAAGTGTSAGTLRVQMLGEPSHGAFVGARVLTRRESGRFGVFAPAVPSGAAAADQGFVWGLRADEETRSNVAVVNAAAPSGGPVTLQLQAFDGVAGGPAGVPLVLTLEPGEWRQPGGFFAASGATNGYVRIVRVSGDAPWFAYGVVNDGSAPGKGTGDGAFVPVVFSGVAAPLPEGAWGEAGVRMWVDADGISIEADCAHGRLVGPVFLDPQGRFSAEGTYAFEGGPTPVGGFPAQRVTASGVVEKGQMSVTLRFVESLDSKQLRFVVTQGVSPVLNKCL